MLGLLLVALASVGLSFNMDKRTSPSYVTRETLVALGIENVDISEGDCAMPDLRCNQRYLDFRTCLSNDSVRELPTEQEKRKACHDTIMALKACRLLCSARDSEKAYKFDDYRAVWGNESLRSEVDGPVFTEASFYRSQSNPGRTLYSRCRNCGLQNDKVLLFLDESEVSVQSLRDNEPRVIANSRHTGITPDKDTCRYKPVFKLSSTGRPRSVCTRQVNIPTFVFFLWNIQNVFHLYADAVLPLMQVLGKVYGRNSTPRDVMLILQPCHLWQSCRPYRILRGDFDPSMDGPLKILQRIVGGRIPVFSKSEVDLLDGVTCFQDIHMGVDLSTTALGRGLTQSVVNGPASALINFEEKSARDIQDIYSIFQGQRWAMKRIVDMYQLPAYGGIFNPLPVASTTSLAERRPNIVLVIQRRASRTFENQAEMNHIVDSVLVQNKKSWNGSDMYRFNVHLEDIPFTKQLGLFQNTAVLVVVHGQAAANSVFLPQELQSTLLLIMPEGWFGWRWLYANMAMSSGVHVVMYRRRDDRDTDGYDGTGNNDLQNSQRDKNITLSKHTFRASFVSAIRLVGGTQNLYYTAQKDIPEDSPEKVKHLPMCLGCYV